MLENLQSVNVFSPNLSEIISNIIISLICSFIVSVIYRYTYKGPGYSESFVHSIVFLSAITALVIMVSFSVWLLEWLQESDIIKLLLQEQ